MKQKFFTLLLGLAMVSVNALADEDPVSVSISKLYGATTYVCNQDLDFSSVATSMRPYYIEDYYTSSGNFALKAFTDGKVPANTPMILIGKQYPTAKASDVITCDVPVAASIDNAAGIRKDVFTKAKGCAWLMPVIDANYECASFNADNAARSDDEKVYNVTFFNYSSGAARVVPQTESVPFGQHIEQNVQITQIPVYYPQYDMQSNQGFTQATYETFLTNHSEDPLFWDAEEEPGYIVGVQPEGTGTIGDKCVMYVPGYTRTIGKKEIYTPKKAAIYVLFGDEDFKYWMYTQRATEGDGNYNSTEGKWVLTTEPSAQIVESYVNNSDRTVYNYVLSVNSSGNPVFKLCNGTSGTTVPYGKCYVSVWSEVKAAASSREDIGIEFAEDEEDLSELNEEVSGIKNVNIKKEANGIYNINGQKLVKLQKGLNIVNGKKVYVK